jgi:predicted RNase H-like nuclease
MLRSMLRGSDNRSKTPSKSKMKWLYGIDGCRGGWVVAKATSRLNDVTFEFASDLGPLFERAGNDSLLAIDIPIGLPQNESRACDAAARRVLGWPRSTSVFSPPCRQALEGETYEHALRLNRDAIGFGISKQAYHIMAKIREVDLLMTVLKQQYVREVHPEVTFAELKGTALIHNKKHVRGRAERIALLRRAGLKVSEMWLAQQRMKVNRARISFDDLIDALACLVTAFAIQNGHSQCLGRSDQKDAKGLAMEIVCCKGGLRPPTIQIARSRRS